MRFIRLNMDLCVRDVIIEKQKGLRVISYGLRRNIIDISVHVLSAFVFCAIIYSASGKLSYAVAFLMGAVFIDLDHLIDNFLCFKTIFALKELFNASHLSSGKVYLILHSWELIFVLFLISRALNSAQLFIFTCGLTVHLTIDIAQRKNKLAYFIFYRLMKKFDAKVIIPEMLEPVFRGNNT